MVKAKYGSTNKLLLINQPQPIKMKIQLNLTPDQFRELKYLVNLQLDQNSNLIKFNEDEELIKALIEIREQLKYPVVTSNAQHDRERNAFRHLAESNVEKLNQTTKTINKLIK